MITFKKLIYVSIYTFISAGLLLWLSRNSFANVIKTLVIVVLVIVASSLFIFSDLWGLLITVSSAIDRMKGVVPAYKKTKKLVLDNQLMPIFELYINDKRYSKVCYKILKSIHKIPNSKTADLLNVPGLSFLTGKHAYQDFYEYLDQANKITYLAGIKGSENARIRLAAGDKITEAEAVSILLNADTLTEICDVDKAFSEINPLSLKPLTLTKKVKVIGALNYLCYKNLENSHDWVVLNLDDKVLHVGYRVTKYLVNNSETLKLLVGSLPELSYSARSHILTELSKEEISDLLSDSELLEFTPSKNYVDVILLLNKTIYLSLLVYVATKQKIAVNSNLSDTLQEMLNLFTFDNWNIDKSDSILDLSYANFSNLTVEDFTTANIAQYFLKLDEYDYRSTHKNLYRNLRYLILRDDYDVNIALANFPAEIDIKVMEAVKHPGWLCSNVEEPLRMLSAHVTVGRINNIFYEKQLIKLVPLLLCFQPVKLIGESEYTEFNISIFLEGLDNAEISTFLTSINSTMYPTLSPDEINLIKTLFTKYVEGVRISPSSIGINNWRPSAHPALFKLNRKWVDVRYAMSFKNYYTPGYNPNNPEQYFIEHLKKVESPEKLEKFILIYSAYPIKGDSSEDFTPDARKKFESSDKREYLFKVENDLSIEEIKTAIVMFENWEGNAEDFLAVVKSLSI